jgi:hypothetical protein
MKKRPSTKGNATPILLLMATSFIIVIYGLLFLVRVQLDYSHRQIASEKALNIAEAGINYYKWVLSHNPSDFADGTGQPGEIYIHEYYDPQGGKTGNFALQVEPPNDGSSVVTIRSTGWTDEYPNVKRTIRTQYGIRSLAEYSFLSNASSWYGVGSIVRGPVHSNNGIRMDGTNYSLVTSAKLDYQCGWETGCDIPTRKPGVWGSGGDQALWQYPVPVVDFESISLDMAQMKTVAQDRGIYLPPSNQQGYHLIFTNDGRVRISRVENTSFIRGYSVPGQGVGNMGLGGCRRNYQIITNESFLGTYDISEIPALLAEDNLWVEGVVKGRITVAAVRFPISSSDSFILIPNNITYASYDGSNSLGLVAQSDIYFDRDVPNYFRVDAILMAQKGTVLRHGYFDWCGGTEGAVKQKLTIYGSIISYYKSYWNFGSAPDSGFIEREIIYDTNMLFNPPPYFPTSGGYEIISWTEE